MIFTIILWILITLVVCSSLALIARKWGVEFLIAAVAGLIVAADLMANKLVQIGPFSVPGGVILFSMTFLLTDMISEYWGKKYALKAVWAGFISSLIMVLSLFLVLNWQASPFALEQAEIFNKALALTPRIVIASLVAYIVSQHHDVWAFHFWKRKTKGKHLWLRNNASTLVSQLMDSAIFVTIAFAGIIPILPVIVGQYVVKVSIAILDTPFMYLIRWFMQSVRREK